MRRLFATLAVVCLFWASPTWATCTGSSPTWTSTPDYASTSSCVSSASRGDTINVTAGDGTESWSSTLTLTKGVSLVGPGRNGLTITMTGGSRAIQIQPDATAIANNELIRVKGFTFDANNALEQLILVTGPAPSTGTKFQKLVIEDNRFQNMGQTNSIGNAVVYVTGQVRGVVANNIINRARYVIRFFGGNDCATWMSGNYPFAYGNSDNLFFESNTIQWSSSYGNGNGEGFTETGQDSRLVSRYNSWNMTNTVAENAELWDQHGFQNMSGNCSGQTGTMISEYYGNTVTNKVPSYRFIAFRGSWGLFHNNVLTNSGGHGSWAIMQYNSGCNNQGRTGWPQPNGEVNNSYGFNNSDNGTLKNLELWDDPATNVNCPPVENASFWNYNASCTSSACAVGIGRGTTAPVGTCTTGVGYWVASTPTPTVDPNVIQNGAFYKCTSTNTWTLYYRPYIYPHPLRNGNASGGDTTPPQAPNGLRLS